MYVSFYFCNIVKILYYAKKPVQNRIITLQNNKTQRYVRNLVGSLIRTSVTERQNFDSQFRFDKHRVVKIHVHCCRDLKFRPFCWWILLGVGHIHILCCILKLSWHYRKFVFQAASYPSLLPTPASLQCYTAGGENATVVRCLYI